MKTSYTKVGQGKRVAESGSIRVLDLKEETIIHENSKNRRNGKLHNASNVPSCHGIKSPQITVSSHHYM